MPVIPQFLSIRKGKQCQENSDQKVFPYGRHLLIVNMNLVIRKRTMLLSDAYFKVLIYSNCKNGAKFLGLCLAKCFFKTNKCPGIGINADTYKAQAAWAKIMNFNVQLIVFFVFTKFRQAISWGYWKICLKKECIFFSFFYKKLGSVVYVQIRLVSFRKNLAENISWIRSR